MASAYAKAAETLTSGSATAIFVSDNGAKAILVLRPLVAAGLTWNRLRKQSALNFEDSVSFPQFPLGLCLPDVLSYKQLGGINLEPRRFIVLTDSGDQEQIWIFP